MKTEEYIIIDSRDIILKEIQKDVWEFSIDGNTYYIDNPDNKMYGVSRKHLNPSFPSDDGPYYDSIFMEQFDNPFKAINFVLNEIF